jgi:glycosyltransferase involved in cell wall biosynthesis
MHYVANIISIIIPCRNEEKYIENCIKSIQSFILPNHKEVEILFIDGESTDNTKSIILNFSKLDKRILLINNPNIFQSFAINIGINKAIGEWILRLDAHTLYPKRYLIDLFETAIETNSDNCGGQIITEIGGDTYGAKIVQALSTHPFGVGDSGFRTESKQGEVDTVPFGFFKKELFNKIGFFDERLIRAQDYEFNRRILRSGGKIWMNPNIKTTYYNQPTLRGFYKKQFFKEAPYNAYMWYLAPYTFAYRHAITGVFATGLIGGMLLSPFFSFIKYIFFSIMVLYFVLAFISAIQQAKRYKNLLHMFTLPISFLLYHFLHGLGVLWGLLRLATNTAPVQKIKEPWSGYGSNRIIL